MSEIKIGYKDVFSQKQYIKLVAANVITRFGDSIDAIAFTWIVYQITQSSSWSAIVFAINMIPNIIFMPFSSALVETLNKKKVMMAANSIRAALVLIFFLLYVTGGLNKVSIVLICICISTAETFNLPAEGALTPMILEKEYYDFGVSLMSALSRIAEIAGLALAGTIIAFWGIQTAIIIDLFTLLAAIIIVTTIKHKEHAQKLKKPDISEYLSSLKEGFVYVKKNKKIANLLVVGAFINFVLVPINAVLVPFIIEYLKLGTEVYTFVNLSITVGVVLGAIVFPYVKKKLNTKLIILLGTLAISITYACWAFAAYNTNILAIYIIMSLSSLLLGISVGVMNSESSVLFMNNVEQEYMARSRGLMGSICSCTIPITSFIISIAVVFVSIPTVFAAAAIISLLYYLFIKIKRVEF